MTTLHRLGLMAILLALGPTTAAPAAAQPPPARDRSVLELLGDSPDEWGHHWEGRTFRRRKPSHYEVVEGAGGLVLQGRSVDSASAVWRKLDLGDVRGGMLSWRWRVERSLPGNAREREARGDDYAARVMVFFGPRLISRKTRALCYVWASQEPVGSLFPNPSLDRVATIVLQSGDEQAGEWVSETRDLLADYRAAFDEDPREIAGVSFMVDTDDTGLDATAWLDGLVLDLGSGTTAGDR